MTQRLINIADLSSLQDYETIIDFTTNSPSFPLLTESSTIPRTTAINPQIEESTSVVIEPRNPPHARYWRPSSQLINKLRFLHEEAYAQFPCAPCCYCGRLLYPLKAVWVDRNSNLLFPFEEL